MRQELLVELHCRCNVCGETWVVANKPIVFGFDTVCCWSTTIREYVTQYLFSDAGGAWIRQRPYPCP